MIPWNMSKREVAPTLPLQPPSQLKYYPNSRVKYLVRINIVL